MHRFQPASFRSTLSSLAVTAAAALAAVLGTPGAGAQAPPIASVGVGVSRSFQVDLDARVMAAGGQALLIDRLRIGAIGRGERHIFSDFPLSMFESVDLDMRRLDAPGRNVPGIIVGANGVERSVRVDPVDAFAGTVVGEPNSRAFFTLGAAGTYGWIEIGDRRFMITSGPSVRPHAPAVFDMDSPEFSSIPWSAWTCGGLPNPGAGNQGMPGGGNQGMPGGSGSGDQGMPGGASGGLPATCVQLEIALDTDNKFFQTFGGNEQSAFSYLQTLVLSASQIYSADVGAGFDVSYWRLWELQDPWTVGGAPPPDPDNRKDVQLSEFRAYWGNNMTAVHRDLTHLLLSEEIGGGLAQMGAICAPAYALSSGISGSFPTPVRDYDSRNWDIVVFTHEIGHNCGAFHTHDLVPAVDCCDPNLNEEPTDGCPLGQQCQTGVNRATIMSYCHLCAGGLQNIALRFHERNVAQMVNTINNRDCLSVGPCTDTTDCVAGISPSVFQVPQAGATITMTIVADPVPGSCSWDTLGMPDWIAVVPPQGSGNVGKQSFAVAANTTQFDRTATFTVGGSAVTVEQRGAAGCTFNMPASTVSAPAGAGQWVLPLFLRASGSTCAWSASSDSDWLTVLPASGTGNANLTVRFLANATAAARTGTITVGGRSLRVTQVAGAAGECMSYNVLTAGLDELDHQARQVVVPLETSSHFCEWTANTDVDWMTVGPQSGAGSRQMFIGLTENRGTAARTGRVYIAGQRLTVTQAAADCSSTTIGSTLATVPSTAGSTTVSVTKATSWCTWTAVANAAWLSASQSATAGSGTVTVSWQANLTTSPREGTVTIGGKVFTVRQQALSTVAEVAAWKSVGGLAATGNSSTTIPVPLNASRLIGFSYNIDFRTIGNSQLGELVLRVEVPGSATRFLSARPSTEAAGGTFAGSGNAAANRFAGEAFDIPPGTPNLKVFVYETTDDGGVMQMDAYISSLTVSLSYGTTSGCVYSIGSSAASVGGAAGSGTFTLNASASNCTWSATSDASWLAVTPAATYGSRAVTFTYAANTSGATRVGRITVAGKTFTVTQTSSAPWTPQLLAGGKVWLKADAIPASDRVGNLVSKWVDSSGDSFLSAAGSARPSFVAGAAAGLPAVRFDGIDDGMSRSSLATLTSNAGGSLFVVRRNAAVPAATRTTVIVETRRNMLDARLALRVAPGGAPQAVGRKADTDLASTVSGTASASTAFTVHGAVSDFAGRKLWQFVNGAAGGSVSLSATPISTSLPTSQVFTVGRAGASPEGLFAGDVAEVLVVSRPLTECERQAVEGYLAHRWGLAASLPAAHPFRSAAPTTATVCPN